MRRNILIDGALEYCDICSCEVGYHHKLGELIYCHDCKSKEVNRLEDEINQHEDDDPLTVPLAQAIDELNQTH